VQLIAAGHSNKEVAARLGLSIKTVETYKGRSLEKLGLRSRADLGPIRKVASPRPPFTQQRNILRRAVAHPVAVRLPRHDLATFGSPAPAIQFPLRDDQGQSLAQQRECLLLGIAGASRVPAAVLRIGPAGKFPGWGNSLLPPAGEPIIDL
jgi:hypothetical protein